ncbi:MAG: hypothetical protein UW24_C0004G0019 [Parcubacteria group bacterium GW2011_GWA2_44_12]|nr:MAG: hypothetical protein UW24_C0004G0019 [Parcubacteria group bacterium GW2011_GWA2_44_12]
MGINFSKYELLEMSLLNQINATLGAIGSTMRYKRTPEPIPGCESLQNKTLTMIDDNVSVLECFAPDLLVATNGKAHFINQQGQSLENSAKSILNSNPNVVLVDYNLSKRFKGAQIVKSIREKGFNGFIFGFSSENNGAVKQEFMSAGANGCIYKDTGNIEESIQELAMLVSQD